MPLLPAAEIAAIKLTEPIPLSLHPTVVYLGSLNETSQRLKNNLDYLVNYHQRQKANLVFTTQAAESHIDALINARHKQKQKMQWTREGAHNVLQI